jgi:hypothetical protein
MVQASWQLAVGRPQHFHRVHQVPEESALGQRRSVLRQAMVAASVPAGGC